MYVQPRKVGNVREEGNGTHFRGHVDSSRKLGQGRVMGSYTWPPTWVWVAECGRGCFGSYDQGHGDTILISKCLQGMREDFSGT